MQEMILQEILVHSQKVYLFFNSAAAKCKIHFLQISIHSCFSLLSVLMRNINELSKARNINDI